MPRMGLEVETHASAEHYDACPSMRTARLSSRLLAQPSLRPRRERADSARQAQRPAHERRSSPSAPRVGRMTHRALARGARPRRRPISPRDPVARSLRTLTPAIGARQLPRGRATDGSVPGPHESTIHLFAHAPRRMMWCSIVDDPEIVESGRPNQIDGPDHDHGQVGNAGTGPRAVGTEAPA